MYKRGKKTRGVSLRKTEAQKSEYLFVRARAPMRVHTGAQSDKKHNRQKRLFVGYFG